MFLGISLLTFHIIDIIVLLYQLFIMVYNDSERCFDSHTAVFISLKNFFFSEFKSFHFNSLIFLT